MLLWIASIPFLLGAWLLVANGCQSGRRSSRELVLAVAGDTAGWIVPCGCASNQSGGLPRRANYVKKLRQGADVVLLDVGGASGGSSDYQRVKCEAILKGEVAMGVDAHNLGEPEAALGADYLRKAAQSTRVPFVSANLFDSNHAPVAPPSRIIERGGLRVGVIGVLSSRTASKDVKIDDPKEAVLGTIQSLKGHCDFIVVLAYLPENELLAMAESVPEADLIVGGPTTQSIAPRRVGGSWLASATNKGKFLAEFHLADRAVQESSHIVEMNDALADDSQQLENIHNYLTQLAQQDLRADQSGFVTAMLRQGDAAYQFAGSASCRACHIKDCNTLEGSGHNHAWTTLQAKGFHVDSFCQQCHTTGFGQDGGFVSASRSANRVGVGCESCHGPSTRHANAPKAHTPWSAKDQCVRCHDSDNSPKFNYATYWPRIVHGVPPTTNQGKTTSIDAAKPEARP